MKIQKFKFNNQVVEFETNDKSLMVNATQMAKIFNKQVAVYMRNEQTKALIDHCLNNTDDNYLGINKIEDLVVSTQKTGTWMHNYLALNFAAWLSPAFNYWIFKMVHKILHGEVEQIQGVISSRRTLLFEKEQLLAEKFEIEEILKEEQKEDKRYQRVEEINRRVREIKGCLRNIDDGIVQYEIFS